MNLVPSVQKARKRLSVLAYIAHQRFFGRVAFIHINKCGGSSVEAALGIPNRLHDTARQRIRKVGRARWERMFTFAVVRHPYARVVSHYKFRVQTNQTGLGAAPIGLNAWVRKAYGERDPRYFNDQLFFQPCMFWIGDADGRMLVDAAYKLETLEADWPEICARAGVTVPLPHVNRSDRAAIPTETLDAEAKGIVRDRFAADFAAFGYDA